MANEREAMGAVNLARMLLEHDVFDDLDATEVTGNDHTANFTADDGVYDYFVIVMRRPTALPDGVRES